MNARLSFTIVILLVIHELQGQEIYKFTYDWTLNKMKYQPFEYTPIQNVRQITFNYKKTKNGTTRKYVKEFNRAGKITSFYAADKSGKRIPIGNLEYNNEDEVVKAEIFKKGELKNTTVYEMMKKGKPLMQQQTNAKGEITFKNAWIYNQDGCLAEFIRYKKGGTEIEKRWAYESGDNCKIAKSTLYNSKGKAIETWTYDCDQEGEQLEKKKNETQVCQWEKTSDTTLTKVYQTFNEKGKNEKCYPLYAA